MIKKRSLANRDIAACILLLIAIIAWFRADIFGHELLAQISILAIFAMSLDLLTGYTGLVSLGHAAFYGVVHMRPRVLPPWQVGQCGP